MCILFRTNYNCNVAYNKIIYLSEMSSALILLHLKPQNFSTYIAAYGRLKGKADVFQQC